MTLSQCATSVISSLWVRLSFEVLTYLENCTFKRYLLCTFFKIQIHFFILQKCQIKNCSYKSRKCPVLSKNSPRDVSRGFTYTVLNHKSKVLWQNFLNPPILHCVLMSDRKVHINTYISADSISRIDAVLCQSIETKKQLFISKADNTFAPDILL